MHCTESSSIPQLRQSLGPIFGQLMGKSSPLFSRPKLRNMPEYPTESALAKMRLSIGPTALDMHCTESSSIPQLRQSLGPIFGQLMGLLRHEEPQKGRGVWIDVPRVTRLRCQRWEDSSCLRSPISYEA
jgi:hypothetical protein